MAFCLLQFWLSLPPWLIMTASSFPLVPNAFLTSSWDNLLSYWGSTWQESKPFHVLFLIFDSPSSEEAGRARAVSPYPCGKERGEWFPIITEVVQAQIPVFKFSVIFITMSFDYWAPTMSQALCYMLGGHSHWTLPSSRWGDKTEIREATCPKSEGEYMVKPGCNCRSSYSIAWSDTIAQCYFLWVTSRDEDFNKWPGWQLCSQPHSRYL